MATATLARHWDVLKESWAQETERGKSRTTWRETDFLPAALEVIETPPNPLGRMLLWTMIAFVAVGILWACLAKIDVVAVAPGRIIAADRNKLVQAADAGVVRAIYVRDGQAVKAGQVLVALDPTTAGADFAQAEQALLTARIDEARIRALLAGLGGRSATFVAPTGTPAEVAVTQQALIRSRLAELGAQVATLQQQAAEARAQAAGAAAEGARLRDTLPLLTERVEKRRVLAEKGYASKLTQLELEQQRIDHERQIGIQAQTARRAQASIAGVQAQIAMSRAEAQRELFAELAKAEAEGRQREEELKKADRRSRLQLVRAPADGVVQQLAVYTTGAVLKAADPILVVVPSGAKLILEAQVLNRDIGFVKVGQAVTVKLEAYPFTRYGTLEGELVQLSRDAVQDEKLGPVYQARVALRERTLQVDGRQERLAPGLVASAEIRTMTRRVIDFLLSPLERRVVEAGRER